MTAIWIAVAAVVLALVGWGTMIWARGRRSGEQAVEDANAKHATEVAKQLAKTDTQADAGAVAAKAKADAEADAARQKADAAAAARQDEDFNAFLDRTKEPPK